MGFVGYAAVSAITAIGAYASYDSNQKSANATQNASNNQIAQENTLLTKQQNDKKQAQDIALAGQANAQVRAAKAANSTAATNNGTIMTSPIGTPNPNPNTGGGKTLLGA